MHKAALQGYSLAFYAVGYCYQYGQGTSVDLAKAREWYEKGAANNDANAIRQLEMLDK